MRVEQASEKADASDKDHEAHGHGHSTALFVATLLDSATGKQCCQVLKYILKYFLST